MKVTVVLCTYNRCRSLAKTLESVSRSVVPDHVEWSVLVVDNNSHDETHSVVDQFRRRFPDRFHYHFEKQQGKSFALNSGVRESSSDVVAFIDDDVEVDPHWLGNLTRGLEGTTWMGVGGRILPELGFVAPNWLETSGTYSLAPLAVFDRGSVACELAEAPFGTNMAYRREMFTRHGGFRTDLGPLPGTDIRHNEDSEFGSRLLARGERFWYEPSAVVYHSVPQERVCKAYFLAWWVDKMRADIRQDGIPKDGTWYLGGVPSYMYRRVFVWTLNWIFALDQKRRFSCKLNLFKVLSTIKECRRLSAASVFGSVGPSPDLDGQ